MPRGLEVCARCGEPRGLALALRARRLGPALGALAAEALIAGLLLAGGYALLPFTPFLVLLPLLMVGRGARHRPRRRRTSRRGAGGP